MQYLEAILQKNRSAFTKLSESLQPQPQPQSPNQSQTPKALLASNSLNEIQVHLSRAKFSKVLPPTTIKMIKTNKSLQSLSEQVKRAEEKKRILLSELKQIDYKLKKMKEQEKMAKKAIEMKPEDTVEKTKRAIELVKKMNEERRQREERKMKEAMEMRKQVQESVSNMRNFKEQQQSERIKKRQQLQERLSKSRENRSQLRHLNIQSNKLINQMKQTPTIFDLTSPSSAEETKLPAIPKKYPRSHFLDNVLKEKKASKLREQIKERQKHLLLERRLSYNNLIERRTRVSQAGQKSIQMHYDYVSRS